jgi:uncharacterized protein (DUF736 family)
MQIGSCWKRVDKNGKDYFSCVIELPFIGKINFAMFEAEKKSDKAPDYQLVWNPEKKDSSIPF